MNETERDSRKAATLARAAAPDIEAERQIYGIDTTVVRFDGAEYYVPNYARHRPVSQRVLSKRIVSPALHRFVRGALERRPGSMLHAGTFFGDMLPSFSRRTPGVVHAFEPVLENYLLARAVVETNHLDNVMLLHSGLGATMGIAQVGVARGTPRRHLGGAARILTSQSKPHSEIQRTPILTVDQLSLEGLALIQLDTEGYELPILLGAAETIRAQSPVIVIEDNKNNCADFLATLGYDEVGRVSRDRVYADRANAEEVAQLVAHCRRSR